MENPAEAWCRTELSTWIGRRNRDGAPSDFPTYRMLLLHAYIGNITHRILQRTPRSTRILLVHSFLKCNAPPFRLVVCVSLADLSRYPDGSLLPAGLAGNSTCFRELLKNTGTHKQPSHLRHGTQDMASKLCCTAEQGEHPDSPKLPNARVNEAPAPARLPLLPKPVGSVNSRFASARTEDLHELQQIFENAKDNEPTGASPNKTCGRARFNKPSIYSLHSLHKMKSMRSLIRRKFSRDLTKKPSGDAMLSTNAKEGSTPAQETVVKHQNDGPNVQVKIIEDDLRKDLLSDKRPDEGGYDSDAQVLDDIARNIGKKTPIKRPSIHSIDWTPSTAR
jgi:hypothetical protein